MYKDIVLITIIVMGLLSQKQTKNWSAFVLFCFLDILFTMCDYYHIYMIVIHCAQSTLIIKEIGMRLVLQWLHYKPLSNIYTGIFSDISLFSVLNVGLCIYFKIHFLTFLKYGC